MTLRRRLGFVAAAVYVGALAYATAGTQCPVRQSRGTADPGRAESRITCATVHALMRAARPPDAPRTIVAVPMRAPVRDGDDLDAPNPLVLAAAGAR